MPISNADYVNMLARTRHNAQRQEAVTATQATPAREADLHDAVLNHCRAKGWICIHSRMDMKATNNLGTFDCIVLADGGRVYLIELKTRIGKLSPDQQAMFAWATKLGHAPKVVRSLEQFIEATT